MAGAAPPNHKEKDHKDRQHQQVHDVFDRLIHRYAMIGQMQQVYSLVASGHHEHGDQTRLPQTVQMT